MKFNEKDLLTLTDNLKSMLELHDVNMETRDSLLSGILFHVAQMIDEKQGSSLHESVFEVIDDYVSPYRDYLVCELGVKIGRKKLETNILHSNIKDPESLRLNLEVLLGLRDISELCEEIDIGARFDKVKVTGLYFEALDGTIESYSKEFNDFDDLVAFVVEVASKWI